MSKKIEEIEKARKRIRASSKALEERMPFTHYFTADIATELNKRLTSEWDIPLNDDSMTLRQALMLHIHRVGKRDRLWDALEAGERKEWRKLFDEEDPDFKARPNATSYAIKMAENPKSAMRFPGAAYLFRHDCMHCLLGVGGRAHGEAFVVGFTAGASRMPEYPDKNKSDLESYLHFAEQTYIDALKFKGKHRDVFRMAFEAARRGMTVDDNESPYHGSTVRPRNLHHFDFENYLDVPIAELRRKLGINPKELWKMYEWEGEHMQGGATTAFADPSTRPAVSPVPPVESHEFREVFNRFLCETIGEVRADKNPIPAKERPYLLVGEGKTKREILLTPHPCPPIDHTRTM